VIGSAVEEASLLLRHTIGVMTCISLLLLTAGGVSAQQEVPTEEQIQEGRQVFAQGTEQARLANWQEARDLFAQAYELARAPIILYNLGGAQRNTGMLIEALESFRTFLSEVDQERFPEEVEQIRISMNELLADIPRVTISAINMREGDSIRFDGQDLTADDLRSARQVNPGEHRVSVVREEIEVETERFTLSATDRTTIEIEAPEPPRDALPNQEVESSRAGLWIGLGVGGAVAIGATVAIILLTAASPYEGNFGNGQTEVP